MRRPTTPFSLALVTLVLLAGCGQKPAQQADQTATSADSLLASNPTEQTTGDITPQTDYQQPAPATTPPVAAPAPAKKPTPKPKPAPAPVEKAPVEVPGVTVPAGTMVKVAVTTKLTSETANPGDPWTGTVKDAVVLGSEASIPAGSVVHGVVTGALPAAKGDRAVLVLRMTSIDIGGNSFDIGGHTDSLIAGSTRARNVGAIAGGVAAGALIGKAVGGGKGALIGGLIGAAGTGTAVAKSKGYQVEVKEGAELTFNVTKDAKIHN